MENSCLLEPTFPWTSSSLTEATSPPSLPPPPEPWALSSAVMGTDFSEQQAQAVALGLGLGPTGQLKPGPESPSTGSAGSVKVYSGAGQDQPLSELLPAQGGAGGLESLKLETLKQGQLTIVENGSGAKSGSSRYECQKKRDWNTFGQYLKNHRPPIAMTSCTAQHVLEFLSYLDQFGKTKVHEDGCLYFGNSGVNPCACPMKQAWGSLDSLVGRLRAAYEENGGTPEANPFAQRVVRVHLREVKDAQAKARGVDYEKRKRRRRSGGPALLEDGKAQDSEEKGSAERKKSKTAPLGLLPSTEAASAQDSLSPELLWSAQEPPSSEALQHLQPLSHQEQLPLEQQQYHQPQHQKQEHQQKQQLLLQQQLRPQQSKDSAPRELKQNHNSVQVGSLVSPLQGTQLLASDSATTPASETNDLGLGGQSGLDQAQVEQQLLLELVKQQQALVLAGRSDPSSQALLDTLLQQTFGRGLNNLP